ncbi:uncharacterized protein METZ01_LOCUS339577, partial [marine metagenome]
VGRQEPNPVRHFMLILRPSFPNSDTGPHKSQNPQQAYS